MKKWLIIVLVIVALLILTVFISIRIEFQKKLSRCEEKEGRISSFSSKDVCYMGLAQDYKSYSICDKTEAKEYCYTLVAIKMNSIKECKKDLVDSDKCYSAMAINQKDENICEMVFDISMKDGCFGSIAIEKKDPSICNKIENKTISDYCSSRSS